MSDDLIPLTLFRYSLPEETPSLGEVAMKRLSTMEVAAWLAVVAILILAFGPLLVNGIRVTTLSILHPGLGNRIQAYEDHQHQEVMYSALMSEAWPMSKLLADVSSNTPEGIELESIRIGHGEPIKVQGMAKPNSGEESSALATRMKAMFQSSGVFDDVTLRWEDSETYGTRSFDISATVRRPQYRPAYALDQDFGHWTLSERRSGQDPEGNWTDDGTVMIASGSSTPSESSTTRSIPPSGNAGSSNVRGATGASSSNSTSTPSISTPTGSPGVERPPTGRNGNTSSRSPRSGANGFSSRGDADDRSADLSTVPTGRLPEPLSEDQIKTFTLEESRIKLQEIAEARKQTRDPEAEKRLKNEFQMLLKHMRDLNRGGG